MVMARSRATAMMAADSGTMRPMKPGNMISAISMSARPIVVQISANRAVRKVRSLAWVVII